MARRSEEMPAWACEPFQRFLDYVDHEGGLLRLAVAGIMQLVAQRHVAEALQKVAYLLETPADEAERRVKTARETAKLAQAEVDADFPLLHAHSIVGLWGALEALVEDVVLAWLSRRRKFLSAGEFANVKIPLAEFQRMTVAQRMEYLLDQVPRRPGVGGGIPRLEDLLAKVDLSRPINGDLRRDLIEMHQIRNVYAHRGGVADRKACAACPWAGWVTGQRITVQRDDYRHYVEAVTTYGVELLRRAAAEFGIDYDAEVAKIVQSGSRT